MRETIEEWDEKFIAPVLESLGGVVKTVAVDGIIKPLSDIVGEGAIAFIESAGKVIQASQIAHHEIKQNRKNLKFQEKQHEKYLAYIDNFNEKVADAIEGLNEKMIASIANHEEPLTLELIKNLHKRTQLLKALCAITVTDSLSGNRYANQLTVLDNNLKALVSHENFIEHATEVHHSDESSNETLEILNIQII